MKNCVIKDENGEKTLCRFTFETYSWKNKSSGEWIENEEYDTPELRLKYYNQKDHLRLYGFDIEDKLKSVGFDVEMVTSQDIESEEMDGLYRIKGNYIFLCRKH